MATDKFILTHRGALLAKYGAAGLTKVESAVRGLVKADAKRGITTRALQLDQAGDMAAYGGPVPATKPTARDVKAAVDRLCAAEAPHYLMLLGGPDIVPLVPLQNPAFGPQGDDDKSVPSDLPYACAAPYSTDPSRFMGPTRVVGRLPDLVGAKQPTLLTRFINAAARAKPLPRASYEAAFSLSAEAWHQSTELSVANTFGASASVHVVPPGSYKWSKGLLAARMHFINCHGGDASPDFYGQPTGVEDYPIAHHAPWLTGKVTGGTVVAAECCYGAQLWDPADAGGGVPMPIAYLQDGALGFFGSTNTAYGPSEGNGSADLICQYFLQQVLGGASMGRAALEARLKFAGGKTHLDPFDLKTLAQFYLLGDPSVQPVAPSSHALTKTTAFRKAFSASKDRTVRQLRRERLERDGKHLAKALPKLKKVGASAAATVVAALDAMARQSGLAGEVDRLSFQLQSAAGVLRHIHVVKGRRLDPAEGSPVVRVVALVATEEDGQLIHVRRLHSR
jgi:hypothetical protein